MHLLKHQEQAIELLKDYSSCAFFHPMGSGKTYTGSVKAVSFGEPILTLCQKSKIDDWCKHFGEIFPDWAVYDLSKPKNIDAFVADGSRRKVGVVSYDTLWRRPTLLKMRGLTLLADESSLISNEQAKRTKAIVKLKKQGRLDHVVLLSGTPIDGKYERLVSQAWLLGWDITKRDFWDRYVITRDLYIPGQYRPVQLVSGYKNTEELKEKLREYGAHFLTVEDCLKSLPSQTFMKVETKAPSAYKKMEKDSICSIKGEELVGNDVLSRRLYLRQICGQYNDARYEAIKDLLETTEERALIFYNFTAEKERLISICESLKKPVSEVSGSKKDLSAYENDEDSVTILQYQAGAMGLNLQKSRIIIYASLPERSELYEQSKCRTWREGQTRPCLYYVCKCPGTIEDDIEEALSRKKDLVDYLFEQGKTA